MQRKREKLSVNASKLGMNVNFPKAKILKVNAKVNSSILLGGEHIELVEEFCYLGSVISTDGGTDKDISVRIGNWLGVHLGPYNQCGSQGNSL